ncbi:g1195 [Coccomyxa elongata]
MCGVRPSEMRRWFLEFAIDGYAWVMEANISMASFCDGGRFFTKPYVTGANYLLKISDYRTDGKGDVVWNALYYRFFDVHGGKLRNIRQTQFAMANLRRKPPAEMRRLLRVAHDFLRRLK